MKTQGKKATEKIKQSGHKTVLMFSIVEMLSCTKKSNELR